MKNLKILFVFILCFNFLSCSETFEDKSQGLKKVLNNIELSQENDTQLYRLDSIYNQSLLLKNDTVKLNIILKISKILVTTNNENIFRKVNKESFSLASQLNNKKYLAIVNENLATYYLLHSNYLDSSYFYYDRALSYFKEEGDYYNQARVNLNIGKIEFDIKDYLNSESRNIKTIELLKKTEHQNKKRLLTKAFSNLGLTYKGHGDYDKSIFYFNQALQELNQDDLKDFYTGLWNNIASSLLEMKKYKESSEYLTRILNNCPDLEKTKPELYYIVLNNYAYNRLMQKDTTNVFIDINTSLEITKNAHDTNGMASTYLNLSTYHLYKNDTAKAIYTTLQAERNAKIKNNFITELNALSQLMQIDKKNSSIHAKKYIKLNDSLQKRDFANQNKFAAIRYNTNQYIEKSQQLSNRLTWVILVGSGFMISLGLLFIIFRQRSRNKELMLIQQKHEADKEIYNLMTNQQRKYEEGKEQEKKRIARDLHDGVLGKLFGLQINLEVLNQENDKESQEKRFDYIDQLREIGQEIRALSHDLVKINLIKSDFSTMIQNYVLQQNSKHTDFSVNIDEEIDFDLLNTEKKINLYHILQEGIQNIQKHANATDAEITIEQIDGCLQLKLWDNGKGTKEKPNNHGIGLKNMKERAKEMDGTIEFLFANEFTNGSLVTLKFPLI